MLFDKGKCCLAGWPGDKNNLFVYYGVSCLLLSGSEKSLLALVSCHRDPARVRGREALPRIPALAEMRGNAEFSVELSGYFAGRAFFGSRVLLKSGHNRCQLDEYAKPLLYFRALKGPHYTKHSPCRFGGA